MCSSDLRLSFARADGSEVAVRNLSAAIRFTMPAPPALAADTAASCRFWDAAAQRLSTDGCAALPSHAALKDALTQARNADNGGFNLDMWGTVVNRDGVVCAVAFTGTDRGSEWPGSRVISAQKANTANAFSLPGLALSTANLWAAVQPGGDRKSTRLNSSH